ncbi:MAG: 50S ribosomal protein L29 [Candidatus Omnitrophica bacterium]|nr:50S ribosomal protein L29 [Candidatus Omnitrophota bacterium]
MKTKELRDLSVEDLAAKEKQIKKELFGLNNQRQLGRVEKPALFKKAKKDIARILTVLNERKSHGKK